MEGQGPAQTGTVVLLLTDHPTDDLDKVYVTINEVRLISDECPPATLFPTPDTETLPRVDLLTLQGVNDLLIIHDMVPSCLYSKIRLRVSEPQFVLSDGTEILEEDIHLVANGKVDLNPRRPFQVELNEILTIQLDMDMEKSVHIHASEGGTRYEFRPVVFVTIDQMDNPGGLSSHLVQVAGEVEDLDPADQSFILEHPRRIHHLAGRDDMDDMDDDSNGDAQDGMQKPDLDGLGGEDGRDHRERHIRVEAGDAAIIDESGHPVGFDALAEDRHVVVRGHLSFHGGLHIEARLIVIGRPMHLRGRIESEVDSENKFTFLPFSEDHELITVQIGPETTIFDLETRSRIEPGDLEAGRRAMIAGVQDADAGLFRAVLIVVKPPGPERLEGTIQGDPVLDTRTFTLFQDDGSETSETLVKVLRKAVILKISQEGDSLNIMPIPFRELRAGDKVQVLGRFEENDDGLRFVARIVVVEGLEE